ncbi:hypothetical protein [Roseibium limicola]|uniref:DUF1127 domain-containing protein n=1 Tax=Roseibium limicola TaxID=2816037 RepID=A0A939ES97_9HYPH|nr:hypothetical protein [Roseibium limicola]MBO0347177.1 hypothetical protein [Roseibium limicola]
MALTYAASPLDGLSHAWASFSKSCAVFFEEVGRARAARALYAEFSTMSDDELDAHGLKRCDVSQTVYAKVYDLR